MAELQSLKSQMEEEQSTLMQRCNVLEEDLEAARLLSEEKKCEVTRLSAEAEDFRKRLQDVIEERQELESRLETVEAEAACAKQELQQTQAFQRNHLEEQHSSVVAELKEQLAALQLEKEHLSEAEHKLQGRVVELQESLREVRESLGAQPAEAEARSNKEQLDNIPEQLDSEIKRETAHQLGDGKHHQAADSNASGLPVDGAGEDAGGPPAAAHSSGWDDAWPDEEEWSPPECPADERIEALQLTLGRYRDEINDLRCILRAQQNNNATNHAGKNPVQLPEPMEYEYLRNILFEYMMGKETVTLSKVIAAVLKFSDEQKDQILQRQEAKQHTQVKS